MPASTPILRATIWPMSGLFSLGYGQVWPSLYLVLRWDVLRSPSGNGCSWKGGRVLPESSVSVWFGTVAIFGGWPFVLRGWLRYRRTREQLHSGKFEPAGFVIDLVAIVTALFGLAWQLI